MDKVPSDIVELIIAVDLDPTDPDQPINVNNVDVRDKGEAGEKGEACHMCTRILDAIAKIDPEMQAAVDGVPVAEAVRALEKMAEGAPEEAQEEADMFTRAMSPDHGEDRPRHKRPGGGGFKAAAARAKGLPFGEDDEDDEDEE